MPPHDDTPGAPTPEGEASPPRREPRPYQAKAIADARAAFREGKRAILLVAPTGAGKTYTFSRIVEGAISKGGKAIVIAHREELIVQAAQSIMAEGIPHVGIIAPWARRQVAPVQVASVQTLAAQIKKGRDLPPASIVVLDEAHHFSSGAPGWFEVANRYRGTLIIGATATPQRGDGSPMGDIFDCLIPVSSVRELQELGVLVPCVTYRPDHNAKALCREPVQAYEEAGRGERCVVFCATVAHAESVAETFRARGLPASTVHANTPWNLRRARLESFKTRDVMPLRKAGSPEDAPIVLCNVYTLTEGWDCPECSVVIVARGCGNAGMLLQMAGRGLRAAPWANKERLILWDLRGTTHKHGLPEMDREYTLDGVAITARTDKENSARRCEACGAEFVTWAVDRTTGDRKCPACGAAAPALEPPDVVEREVFAVGSGAKERDRMQALERLAMTAADRGYRAGWVRMRYYEQFGEYPPRGADDEAVRLAREVLGVKVTDEEIEAERARLTEIARSRGIPLGWVEKKIAEKYGEAAA